MEQTNIIFPQKTPLPHGSSVIFHHFYTSKHALKWEKIKIKNAPHSKINPKNHIPSNSVECINHRSRNMSISTNTKKPQLKKKKKTLFLRNSNMILKTHDRSKFNTIRIQTHTNQKKKRQSPCISYEKFIKNFEKRSSRPGNRTSIRKTPPS